MLIKRIITASILIPLVFALLFFLSPQAFCFLTLFIILFAAWEWSYLTGMKKVSWRLIYSILLIFLMLLCALFIPIPWILWAAFLWWLVAFVCILFYPRGNRQWGKHFFWRSLMGMAVLLPCWIAINDMRNQPAGKLVVLFFLLLIWIADSGAYLTGKKWGKHKLAAHISPGKTWEGLGGALFFSLLLVLVALWLCNIPLALWPWAILLSLVTILFSVIGDLFESMLKRQAHLKDSGTLFPGHGGLLDRIDSLTAAAPIFSLGAILLGKYFGVS